jgi:hypothetical protein
MSTSPTISNSKHNALRKVSKGDMAYACARYQHQVHNLLVRVIKESGISQKELARITEIDEATISRLLSRPRNMEGNTLSKLVYGASGATLTLALAYPQTGRSIVLVSKTNVAVEQKETNARRFVIADVCHQTPVGIASASTDSGVFDRFAIAMSSSGRIRETTNA